MDDLECCRCSAPLTALGTHTQGGQRYVRVPTANGWTMYAEGDMEAA